MHVIIKSSKINVNIYFFHFIGPNKMELGVSTGAGKGINDGKNKIKLVMIVLEGMKSRNQV